MRIVVRVVGILIAFGLFVLAAQWIAAESGSEIVVLTTHDATGAPHETRLWVVDIDGIPYLRAGTPHAGWYKQLLAVPAAELTRDGKTAPVRAVAAPELRAQVNDLMAEKYGTPDKVISMTIDRSASIPMRLEPRS